MWLQSPLFLKFLDCVLGAGRDYSSPVKFPVAMERAALKVTMKVDKSENFRLAGFQENQIKMVHEPDFFTLIFTNVHRVTDCHLPFKGQIKVKRFHLVEWKSFSVRLRFFFPFQLVL